MNITKAVIPLAGLGTRFLPFTKAVPKGMLPLIDKPAIQEVIEEALASGISHIYPIIGADQPSLKEHFEPNRPLDAALKEKNKEFLLAPLNSLINNITMEYLHQPQPLGLGHAILMAKEAIGNDYFGIILPDDLVFSPQPALSQLITIAKQYNASVIAVREVPLDTVSSYGVVCIKHQIAPGIFEISGMVEKPKTENAPSNLAIIGRYVLSPSLFASLETTRPSAGNEIQLTDGIADMIKRGERVLAYTIQGDRYDIGVPLGWLEANIVLALKNPLYSQALKQFITDLKL